jgi:hypothetical protein
MYILCDKQGSCEGAIMNTEKKIIQDPDLARVEAALQRAAKKARKTAKDTRTPLIIYKDGKIRRYRVYNEDIS